MTSVSPPTPDDPRATHEADATPRCECGHPENCHTRSMGPGPLDSKSACVATIYETVPHGMNAWPCNCRRYSPASVVRDG